MKQTPNAQRPTSERRIQKFLHWALDVRRCHAVACEAVGRCDVCFLMEVQDDQLATIRAAFPREGLFAEKDWLLSPDAFPIEKKFVTRTRAARTSPVRLSTRLQSALPAERQRKTTGLVARYLGCRQTAGADRVLAAKAFRDDLPRVIRPDLILTDEGYIIAEIDSVPGGIGSDRLVQSNLSALDGEIIGGADGMLDGFQSVLPNGGDIVISQESATYRPEMEWMAGQLEGRAPSRPGTATRGRPTPVIGSMARRCCGKLRTAGRAASLPVFRVVRSAKHPEGRQDTAAVLMAESRSRRQSSRISRRRCGSRSSGCNRCANSGDAN